MWWRWWRAGGRAGGTGVADSLTVRCGGLSGSGRTHATVQYRPQPRRLFAMITSVTASNTNWMLLVSVAHVWWQYISFDVLLFFASNCAWMYAAASSYVCLPATHNKTRGYWNINIIHSRPHTERLHQITTVLTFTKFYEFFLILESSMCLFFTFHSDCHLVRQIIPKFKIPPTTRNVMP